MSHHVLCCFGVTTLRKWSVGTKTHMISYHFSSILITTTTNTPTNRHQPCQICSCSYDPGAWLISRAHRPHKLEVAGSIPALCTPMWGGDEFRIGSAVVISRRRAWGGGRCPLSWVPGCRCRCRICRTVGVPVSGVRKHAGAKGGSSGGSERVGTTPAPLLGKLTLRRQFRVRPVPAPRPGEESHKWVKKLAGATWV